MKFECSSCHAQYMIADEKVGKRGVKVKCKKCAHVIIVKPGHKAPDADAAAAPAPAEQPEAEPKASDADEGQLTAVAPPPEGFERELARATLGESQQQDNVLGTTGSDERAGDVFGAQLTDPGVAVPAPAPVSMFGGAATQLAQALADPPADAEAPATSLPMRSRSAEPEKTMIQVSPQPEPEPKRESDPTMLSEQPNMSLPEPKNAAPAGSELDDELAGAFGAIFDPAQAAAAQAASDEADAAEAANPTRVLDTVAMNALRQQAMPPAPAPEPSAPAHDPMALEPGLVIAPARPDTRQNAAPGADDGPPDAVWHVAIDDQDVGPLSLAELGRHIESGRVDKDTLVWKAGLEDWLPAGRVDQVSVLFERTPMPKIGDGIEFPKGRSDVRDGGRDMGRMFADATAAPAFPGATPFDETSDPSWQPHGLTDVYQAANLAEAAGGGLAAAVTPSVLAKGGLSTGASPRAASKPATGAGLATPDEPGWRPGAASALASLVQDEMRRLEQPLPPGDDDTSMPPAPLFGGLSDGLMGNPDTTQEHVELSDRLVPARGQRAPTAQAMPAMSAMPSLAAMPAANVNGAALHGGMNAPSFETSVPNFGAPLVPAPEPKSKLPLFVGGAVVAVLLVVVVVVALLRGNDTDLKPGDIVKGPDGNPAFIVAPNGSLQPLQSNALRTEPERVAAAPAPTTPEPAAAAPAAVAPAAASPTPVAAVPAASETPPPAKVEPAEAPAKVARADPPKRPAVRETRPPPPPKEEEKPVKRATGCDPLLDVGCTATITTKKEPAADVRDTLSRTDVYSVIKSGLPAVEACGKKHKVSGLIKMTFRVQTSGKTTDVQVADSKFAGTPVGACVTGVIRNLKFPAHKTAISPVTVPFKLP